MITGYCIIRDHTVVYNGKIIFQGENKLNDFLDNAYSFFKINYPKFYKMDNLSKLGFLAAEVLLKERSLTTEYQAESVALVLSNAHASLDTDIRYAETAKTMGSPALFVYTLPNIVAGEICIRHKIKGENAFFVTPSFDADLMASYVDLVLTPNTQAPNPKSQALSPNTCLCGWIDVMGEHHDVFLYLTEKNKKTSLAHTADQLRQLYNNEVWNN